MTGFQNELTFHTMKQAGAEDKFHESYEQAVESVRQQLTEREAPFPLIIGGERVTTKKTFTVYNPAKTDGPVGDFAKATEEHVEQAVEAAKTVFDRWRTTPYADRAAIFERAAEIMRERKFELGAALTLENGKNRTEAMADVDEAIDFLAYYSQELRRNNGYEFDTGEPTPGQHTTNLLRPYGVFAVIAPFNFPLAILVGMTAGALITGNTAVVKPASATPYIAHVFFDILEEAGLPAGVANLVTGGGRDVGDPLVQHPDVQGVVFTGSREVGLKIQETFIEQGKRGPVIAELGGKNPVIVTDRADLDKAVPGVVNGAFSFGGQKCSATSRVYVHEAVADEFIDRLARQARTLVVGKPEHEETFVGPVIDDDALDRYETICKKANKDGEVLVGGERETEGDLERGRFVRPTVVTGLPHDHELAREEHFLPFVTVHRVSSLDEAIEKANDSDYALCAGLFSEDQTEIDQWFDRIEAGMTYVNRSQSATTGALVYAQAFGGWKFSGTTGTFAGGRWYLPQFMKEQTRTLVRRG